MRDKQGNEWNEGGAWLQNGNGDRDILDAVVSREITPAQAADAIVSRISRRERLLRASAAARATRGLVLFLLSAAVLLAIVEALR